MLEGCVLLEELREAWRARERAASIYPVMSFEPEGLVLGAGTVLVPAYAKRRLMRVDGEETRILALLSAAYGTPVEPAVLGNIERASACWAAGEDCQALIHLALTGLHKPEDRREAARRLFMADGLIKAGIAPRTILQALGLQDAGLDAIEKYYNQYEARILAGNGRLSGEWARVVSVLEDLSLDAARFLVGFVRTNPVTFAVGLALIPWENDIRVEGDVAEVPGLSYFWNRDEQDLTLTYRGPNGTRTLHAMLDVDGTFRDGNRVVARQLPGGLVAIDPAMVSADLADKEGPNLCPVASKDNAGRPGEGGDKDKDYEDQIKRLVNPDNPTPRGYAYQYFNPVTGRPVMVDDCQHQTGTLVEIKSEYDHLLAESWGQKSITKQWLAQSANYVQVSRGFPIDWVFAQQGSADFARKLFDNAEDGQKRISTLVVDRMGEIQ